jgi:hypothetical protein
MNFFLRLFLIIKLGAIFFLINLAFEYLNLTNSNMKISNMNFFLRVFLIIKLGAIFFLIKLAFEYLNFNKFQYELLSKTFLNY